MNIDDDFEEDFENITDDSKNIIASRIRVWAIIDLMCGIVLAFLLSGFDGDSRHWKFLSNRIAFISWIIIGILSWLALSGFAEIIQILHDIRRNQKK